MIKYDRINFFVFINSIKQIKNPFTLSLLNLCTLTKDIACGCFKADSHIACRAHAAPMPFPCYAMPLIHTCQAAPLPCTDNAVSLVKVILVAGNFETASPTVCQIVFLQCATTTFYSRRYGSL